MNILNLNLKTFMADMKQYAEKMSLGVTLCILSPVLLISMSGFVNEEGVGVSSDTVYLAVGIFTLLIMVAIGVMLIITSGLRIRKYEFVKNGEFQLEENKIRILEEEYYDYENLYGTGIAIGVGLCIVSAIPLITVAVLEMGDRLVLLMVSVLLVMVAIAVNLFIRNSIKRSSYMQLLKRDEFEPNRREAIKREESVGSIYWPIVVAVYLGWSFIRNGWMISWVVFPIAALIYAGIVNYIKRH